MEETRGSGKLEEGIMMKSSLRLIRFVLPSCVRLTEGVMPRVDCLEDGIETLRVAAARCSDCEVTNTFVKIYL